MRVPDRTRLLRVIARLNVGGPALHATLLTQGLAAHGYESMLVTGEEGPSEGNYLRLHKQAVQPLVVLPALGRELHPARDARVLVELTRLIRRFRPDIVHTHTAKAGAVGRLAALFGRVPVIVHTYHGHVFDGYFSPIRTRTFLAIDRWLARRTSCLVTVSETLKATLLGLGIGTAGQWAVVPLGMDLDRFIEADRLRGELRRELGLGGDVGLVGIVARLVPIKAHDIFLTAAVHIARALPTAHFVIVGDGERRDELLALAGRLGLADRVHFLGWRGDLERIYADLDVVVLSSRNEGSPVSLIEAMAAGKPVVATRVGGVADLVEHLVTGYLVDPGDAAGLAAGTLAMLADRDRARAMGHAGCKKVDPLFTAPRLLRDVDALYTRLLARVRR